MKACLVALLVLVVAAAHGAKYDVFPPPSKCLGDKLQSRQAMESTEGICAGKYRFGLTIDGELCLWKKKKPIWCAIDESTGEPINSDDHYANMNHKGKFVVYEGDKSGPKTNRGAVFPIGCKDMKKGARLKIVDKKRVVRLVHRGKILWSIDSEGKEDYDCE